MKKILLLCIILSSSLLQADLIRVEMGAGVWSHGTTGDLKDKNGDDLDIGISQNMYLWAYLKHPVPLIPNARLEYTNNKMDDTDYELNIEQIDAILYYNILDNLAWITLDVGLDLNFMKQSYQFGTHSTTNDSIVIPLLYGRGRFEIPGTGFGLETEVKYYTYGDSTISDIRAKVDYTFDFSIVEPGVELGYRYNVIKTSHNDFSSLSYDTDVVMSGVYLGAMLRF